MRAHPRVTMDSSKVQCALSCYSNKYQVHIADDDGDDDNDGGRSVDD